jgi:Raf kinase inhibitor-like YbhB/YbcL family protein
MRRVYAIIGISFIILLAGASYAFNRASRPIPGDSIERMAETLSLTSGAFADGGPLPSRYTCDYSAPTNPPLAISGVPEGTKTLVLIVDDPDVPKRLKPDLPAQADGVFDHWVLFNIPVDTATIGEGDAPGLRGASGTGKGEYVPPCPPPQYEPSEHRYVFALYALDTELSLPEGASKQEVLDGMEGHIIAETKLVGRYKRQ